MLIDSYGELDLLLFISGVCIDFAVGFAVGFVVGFVVGFAVGFV